MGSDAAEAVEILSVPSSCQVKLFSQSVASLILLNRNSGQI